MGCKVQERLFLSVSLNTNVKIFQPMRSKSPIFVFITPRKYISYSPSMRIPCCCNSFVHNLAFDLEDSSVRHIIFERENETYF